MVTDDHVGARVDGPVRHRLLVGGQHLGDVADAQCRHTTTAWAIFLASRMSFSIATTSGSMASDMICGGQPGWKSIGTYQVLARRPATPG